MNPLTFHNPHLTLPPMSGREPEDPQAAAPAPKRPATVVARSAVGVRDAAMLGEVEDLAQRMDGREGDKCGDGDEFGEDVELQELAMIGSMWGVELGAPSSSCWIIPQKRLWACGWTGIHFPV